MLPLGAFAPSSSCAKEQDINLSLGRGNTLSEKQVKLYLSSPSKGHGHRNTHLHRSIFFWSMFLTLVWMWREVADLLVSKSDTISAELSADMKFCFRWIAVSEVSLISLKA